MIRSFSDRAVDERDGDLTACEVPGEVRPDGSVPTLEPQPDVSGG
jgi:hypothetical protein